MLRYLMVSWHLNIWKVDYFKNKKSFLSEMKGDVFSKYKTNGKDVADKTLQGP